jgi:hypothetical protein
MTQADTLILRAALAGDTAVYRDIEIEPTKSLYKLAEAIIDAFGFDFDHCFGFYTGLTPAKMLKSNPRYELFADIGEADPAVLSVKKTKVAQAFPARGHTSKEAALAEGVARHPAARPRLRPPIPHVTAVCVSPAPDGPIGHRHTVE